MMTMLTIYQGLRGCLSWFAATGFKKVSSLFAALPAFVYSHQSNRDGCDDSQILVTNGIGSAVYREQLRFCTIQHSTDDGLAGMCTLTHQGMCATRTENTTNTFESFSSQE
jgi:hypothetical protein